ncbi:hypothetical protein GGR56DRAFT_684376 [Xylariaceae sp. FL0804]|nr:hypothetical protein GGR56DRAFT_684376 [Xylariaceae sp. FL0804]
MAVTDSSAAPSYGRRLLPQVVDDIARDEPEREAFSVPRSSDPADGWRPVTFKAYANAVNHVAHRIIEECGTPPSPPSSSSSSSPDASFPTIAYIGPNDARYVVVVLAAAKAGYKALLISPRNAEEGQLNLFDKTDCRILAFARSHRQLVQPWLREREMLAVEVAPVEKWFPEQQVAPFPYNRTFEQAEWEPLLVLHTSGSTGLPKPVVARNGMLAVGDAFRDLPEWHGTYPFICEWARVAKRHFIPMPLFHAAGMYIFLTTVIWYKTPVALGLVDRPLSSDSVVECLEHADVEGAILPPAILEDMSQSESYIKPLAKLKMVVFGGGNLARDAGNRLVEGGVAVTNAISATEFLPFPHYLQRDPNMWQYFLFNSEVFGADWRKHEGEDDVYRLVVKRKDKNPGLQGFFYTFPDDDEYDTKDLYKPHPTEPDQWIYYGRSDDIIVFSNGEKLNPSTIEQIVGDHPELKGTLVVGAQRFQPALIIEPTQQPSSEDEARQLIERVWPTVVRANKETVAHGQIGKEYIMISNPAKPFARAGKGTIQRAHTVKLYQDEIDGLYERAGEFPKTEAPRIDVSSEQTLMDSISDMFRTRLGSAMELGPDADFFSAGVDSMQIIAASRLLRAGLEAAGCHVDATTLAARVIYGNPTPRKLARYIFSLVRGGTQASPESEEQHELQAMKFLWERFTSTPPKAKKGRPEARNDNQVVVLTGSTGMLGSYMLDMMIKNPRVARVVCLNRSEDGATKQSKAMRERGLASDLSKCTFYQTDLSRSDFGLPRDVYRELLASVDRVIHNAWPVNFNIPVESFAPHIQGVRNVGDFAAGAARRVAVVFVSSIGTADRWDARGRDGGHGPVAVPEARLEDLRLPGGGYGRSKMVGSLVLEDVARPDAGDFPAASIRVGQIAGPAAGDHSDAGAWNRHEWLPSIVASSLHLGALPRELGHMERVDWTPCERVAALVLEVAGVAAGDDVAPEDISGYYHGVNPRATRWADLAPAVQEFYGEGRIRRLVGFAEWVGLLEASQAADTQALDRNPGVKLIDTYRAMAGAGPAAAGEKKPDPVVFDMRRTTGRSEAMRTAEAVTPALMRHWCKQWAF